MAVGMNMKRMVRLKDVALSANVSNTTASLILNGKGKRFCKDTQERVEKIARKMAWEPNLLSNSILSGKTQTIGILVGPCDSYYNDVLTGMHRELMEREYLPITIWENIVADDLSKNDNGLAQIKRLIGRRVDGLILRPVVALSYESHIKELSKSVPVVVIDHMFDSSHKADSVGTDEKLGMKLAFEHLVGLGHRKIAYIDDISLKNLDFSSHRRAAFEYAAKKNVCEYAIYDIDLLENQCGKDKYSLSSLSENVHSRKVVKNMLHDHSGVTAVVCASDYIARLVYGIAKDEGVSIPEDISVVGYAGLDFTSELDPPLTAVRQNGELIGRKAAEIIVKRIEGELIDSPHQAVQIGCELLVRQSTGKVF